MKHCDKTYFLLLQLDFSLCYEEDNIEGNQLYLLRTQFEIFVFIEANKLNNYSLMDSSRGYQIPRSEQWQQPERDMCSNSQASVPTRKHKGQRQYLYIQWDVLQDRPLSLEPLESFLVVSGLLELGPGEDIIILAMSMFSVSPKGITIPIFQVWQQTCPWLQKEILCLSLQDCSSFNCLKRQSSIKTISVSDYKMSGSMGDPQRIVSPTVLEVISSSYLLLYIYIFIGYLVWTKCFFPAWKLI